MLSCARPGSNGEAGAGGSGKKGQVGCGGVCDRKGCEMKCLGGGGTEARHGCSRSWACGRQEVTAM